MIEIISTKEKIINYLNDGHFDFRKIDHPPAATPREYHRTLGTKYEQQAKTLLLQCRNNDKKGFIMVTIQARKQVDLALIAKIIGAEGTILAGRDQLKEITGCDFGEIPPISSLFGLLLLMDKDLLEQDTIYFNAGDLSFSIAMAPEDLLRLERAILF